MKKEPFVDNVPASFMFEKIVQVADLASKMVGGLVARGEVVKQTLKDNSQSPGQPVVDMLGGIDVSDEETRRLLFRSFSASLRKKARDLNNDN